MGERGEEMTKCKPDEKFRAQLFLGTATYYGYGETESEAVRDLLANIRYDIEAAIVVEEGWRE